MSAYTLSGIADILENGYPPKTAAAHLRDIIKELASQSAVAPGMALVPVDREDLQSLIDAHLTSMYACTRVWEAWGVGTMSEDDFVDARETDFASDLAGEIMQKLAAAPVAAVQPPFPKDGWQDAADQHLASYGKTSQEFATPKEAVRWLLQIEGEAAIANAAPVQPPAVPEGWQLVKIEPTKQMLAAMDGSMFGAGMGTANDVLRANYAALLAASPPVSQPLPARGMNPLTKEQIDALFPVIEAEVAKLTLDGRYSFAGWLPVAVREVERLHGIGATPGAGSGSVK